MRSIAVVRAKPKSQQTQQHEHKGPAPARPAGPACWTPKKPQAPWQQQSLGLYETGESHTGLTVNALTCRQVWRQRRQVMLEQKSKPPCNPVAVQVSDCNQDTPPPRATQRMRYPVSKPYYGSYLVRQDKVTTTCFQPRPFIRGTRCHTVAATNRPTHCKG
jgi:hypothetical protein